jgi:hypothetical protein
MAVKIKSDKACSIVIEEVTINPQITEISDADYAKVKDSVDYKALKSQGSVFEIQEQIDEPEVSGEITIDKMSVAQLKSYAKDLGLELPEGAKKAEIVDLIKEIEE